MNIIVNLPILKPQGKNIIVFDVVYRKYYFFVTYFNFEAANYEHIIFHFNFIHVPT